METPSTNSISLVERLTCDASGLALIHGDLTERLGLLSLLPDAGQKLAEQQLKIFDTFTWFPRLPAELRLKIWEFTLPTRRVYSFSPLSRRGSGKPHFHPGPVPAALYVCSESRNTVISKCWLFRTVCVHEKTRTKHSGFAVFDTATDLAYIPFWDVGAPKDDGTPSYFQERMESRFGFPSMAQAVRVLEVRGVMWGERVGPCREWASVDGPLKYFSGLQELHLVARNGRYDGIGWSGGIYDKEEKMCLEALFTCLVRLSKKDGRAIPSIYLHQWRRLKSRSEEENRTDGLWAKWEWKKYEDEEGKRREGPVLVEGKTGEGFAEDGNGTEIRTVANKRTTRTTVKMARAMMRNRIKTRR